MSKVPEAARGLIYFYSMLRKGQEGHVRAEKDILAAAATAADSTSRWIVKLHYSFQVSEFASYSGTSLIGLELCSPGC